MTTNPYIISSTYPTKRDFTFTGKERDDETGYSYFSARYYDSGLPNIFLSVDPMSDKYPNISPYAYCAWNPVKLVDPDGKDIWEVSDDGSIKRTGNKGGRNTQTVKYANGTTAKYHGGKYHTIMNNLSHEKGNISTSFGDESSQDALTNVFLDMSNNTKVEWRLDRYKGNYYSLGTAHTEEESLNTGLMSNGLFSDKDLITMIHSHPLAKDWINPESRKTELSSMGYWGHKTSMNSDKVNKTNHARNVNYYTYFPRTKELWAVGVHNPAYIKKVNNYRNLFFGTINSR